MADPDLSALRHEWRPSPRPDVSNLVGEAIRYECSCLLSTGTPYAALCPDRVAAALDAAREDGRLAGLREAAEECDRIAALDPPDHDCSSYSESMGACCMVAGAAAIRRLAGGA